MNNFAMEKFIGHKTNRIVRNIDKYFERKRSNDDGCIPRGQGMIVGYIMDNPDRDIFQKDIEANLHLSGATVTTMLKNLEKNGLVIRTPMENDGRFKKIQLTQKAFEHEIRVRQNILNIEAAIREGFTQEELDRLNLYLDRIIDNVERLNAEK